ncbi:MAG TPA: A24 family peptidase [Phycisphaerae bacterium]|nr:A24 family peptidase [Phycisphaerae bacterium]
MSFLGLTVSEFAPLQIGVLCGACMVAAATDIASRRIPNWLTIPLLATGVAYSTMHRGPWGLLDSIAAALILALPYLFLFVYARGGGGDVKLMAAVGAWTGVVPGLVVLFMVALAGVAMGIVVALTRGQFQTTMRHVADIAQQAAPAVAMGKPQLIGATITGDRKPSAPMPYGVAIFVGVCAAVGGLSLWHG